MRKQFWRFVSHHDPYGQQMTCFAEIDRDAVIAKAEAAGYIVLNRNIGHCFREEPGLLLKERMDAVRQANHGEPRSQQG
ncbi:hypothetical protein LCGC14_1982130 [marine sediment metagenome]|uniref:Uncharacterized protein n=1 Tax=marine sediment metagenome TaxID=412755 RepID=A0A0F9HLU0_9ZZZZ